MTTTTHEDRPLTGWQHPDHLPGITVTTWDADAGDDGLKDGALVVQIDTDGDRRQRVRINLNDAPVWDGVPEDGPSPEAAREAWYDSLFCGECGATDGPFVVHEEVETCLPCHARDNTLRLPVPEEFGEDAVRATLVDDGRDVGLLSVWREADGRPFAQVSGWDAQGEWGTTSEPVHLVNDYVDLPNELTLDWLAVVLADVTRSEVVRAHAGGTVTLWSRATSGAVLCITDGDSGGHPFTPGPDGALDISHVMIGAYRSLDVFEAGQDPVTLDVAAWDDHLADSLRAALTVVDAR